MKFTCEKNVLLQEISVAQEIISSKNALSILSNVLLIAETSTLIIKATDLKVSFETRVPISAEVPGSTTVFCDKFLGILRSLPEGEVEFEQDDQRLVIRPLFKKIDFQLKSIASDKFPELNDIADDKYFSIAQKDLNDMISDTIFAVSDDETRYFMNGVFMEYIEGKINMVATDGRRLSLISKEIPALMDSFKSVIIPPKVLNLVRKLSSGEGNILVAVSDKNIFFKFDNQKLSSNLIEGQFPNYRRVIPEVQTYQAGVGKPELMEALKRVSLLVEQKSRRIFLEVSEGNITLKSEESEIGMAKEEIPCDYSGPSVVIALNCLYLLDPLKVMEEEKVVLKFTEPNKAISLYPTPEKDFFHIVMPMQLD